MKAIEGVIKGNLSPFFFFLDAVDKEKSEEPQIWRITQYFVITCMWKGDSILSTDSSTVMLFLFFWGLLQLE